MQTLCFNDPMLSDSSHDAGHMNPVHVAAGQIQGFVKQRRDEVLSAPQTGLNKAVIRGL